MLTTRTDKAKESTHIRIHLDTLDKLRDVAQRYNAYQVDVLAWLVDLAYSGEVKPKTDVE